MANESINAWNSNLLVASEASVAAFGTVPDPAASQAFEAVSCDMGPAGEQGDVRPKKDRNALGRGPTQGFVEGRIKPIPFSIEASVKSRATATTIAKEDAIYRGGGMIKTVGGSNVIYSLDATPLATTNGFLGCDIYRAFGAAPYIYEAEQLRGGVVKTIEWSGGDSELMVKASGEAIGKEHLGFCSWTVNNSVTTFTFADIEEGSRFGKGWYQSDSEIVKITAMDYPTFTAGTIARAQLASSAASHASALRPYLPSMSYSGSPISEGATVTLVVDGVTIRAMKFSIVLTTGMDLLPGQSGSQYILGPKAGRYALQVSIQLVLTQEQVALLGKARRRNTCAISIVQSSGTAGGIFTFSLPYTEVMPFKVPDTANDVAIVDVGFRVRDNSGNDAFTLTCA